MRKINIYGLALIVASVLTVSAADTAGWSIDNKTKSAIQNSLSVANDTTPKRSEKSSLQAVRDSVQNKDSGVLTRDDVDKATAYQGLIDVVKQNLDSIDDKIMLVRRQIAPTSRQDLDDIQSRLDMSEKALNELASQARYSVDRIQEEDLRDRLFEQKLSVDLLRRRMGAGGAVLTFGLEFFSTISGEENIEPSAVPRNYTLRPKDKILILASSKLGTQTEYHEEVTEDGMLNIPGVGKIKALSVTVSQLNVIANKRIKSRFNQMRLDLSIESISTMAIQIAGSVSKPGTYTMSGMSTVMSALYKAGGPSASGTLRNIVFSRAGMPKRKIDLYKFLMEGSKDQDFPLRDGDLIFVPPVGDTIIVDGEVVRAARYEPKFPLTLADALKMAGGVKASGYLQQVSVERIENGEYRILINTSIQDGAALKYAILPGDQISVSTVRPERTNIVTISGPVLSSGAFGFRPNMRVSELITLAQGIDPNREVYSGRADILRLDSLKGTELISFDLGKAIAKDPSQDIELHKLDRVFLYLPEQVIFKNNRIRISGAVSNPGVYDRKDGMSISDVVAAAGGVLPEAHLQRADLIRYKTEGAQELVKINLESALGKNVNDDIKLYDRDELMIYTNEETGWKDARVRIEGSVQRPGTYKRVDNMRLSDLLFTSGGLLPEASKLAEIGRVVVTGQPNITKVNLDDLVPGSEQDPLICDRDTVTVPSVNSILRVPQIVYLTGEVQNPGPYSLESSTERLSELVKRAGGLTPRADTNCLIFMRNKESFDNDQQRKDVQTIIKSVLLYADRQFVTQLSQMGIKLPDNFLEKTQQSATELANPLGASEIRTQQDGIVRVSDESSASKVVLKSVNVSSGEGDGYPDFGKSSMEDKSANLNKKSTTNKTGSQVEANEETSHRLSTLTAETAFGERLAKLSQDEVTGLAAVTKVEEVLELARISVNFKQALSVPGSDDDLIMRSGDRIHIPMITDTVTVLGAVLHPHVFAASSDKTIAYYVERSGGYARDAAKGSTIIVHTNGDAVPATMVKTVIPGDIIVVPNNGLIDVAKKWEKIGSVTKIISDVLSSVFVLTRF